MNILVTGAAGYIGSVVTDQLVKPGNKVVALDNLKYGHREAVNSAALFYEVDLRDPEAVDMIFYQWHIDVVVHLAAESLVGRSVSEPRMYFESNVVYGMTLLQIMLKHGVERIIFSSTASVYGTLGQVPITERSPKKPVNP